KRKSRNDRRSGIKWHAKGEQYRRRESMISLNRWLRWRAGASPSAIPRYCDKKAAQSRAAQRFGKTESVDQCERLVCLHLSCGSWLCGKLEHCYLLTFNQGSQEHNLTVWKLQRIMMCMRHILVDLPEHGCGVIDCASYP